MTNTTPRIMTIFLTAILFTGGIMPFSFANNYDDYDDEYYECEIPSIFSVMYNGPDNVSVEIYKQPKHAKNSEKLVHSYSQTFNNGDYIVLNSETDLDREQIKSRTTYKIMDGSDEVIIPVNTSCKRPLSIGDVHQKEGMTLTVMSGTDLDNIPVIFEKYHYETGDDSQTCNDGQVIDFGSLDHGASHSDVVSYFTGLNIGYDVDANNSLNEASIYDSTSSGGADPDLEDPQPTNGEIKNLLIIAEEGSQQPDDEKDGGTHILEFETPIELKSLRVVDIEENENPATLTGFLADGSGSISVPMEVTGNDKQRLMDETDLGDLANANIDKLTIMLPSSGAVTNLCIKSVEPIDPTITLVKQVDNTLGGEAESDDFQLQINGVNHPQNEAIPVIPNNDYVITEELPLPDGYEQIGFDGDCNEMGVIEDIQAGEQKTCIVINKFTEVPTSGDASITMFKVIINDDGIPLPTIDEFGIKLNVTDGEEGFEIVDISVNGTTVPVNPDNPVSVIEDGKTGYDFIEIRGDGHCPENLGGTVTLSENQHINCYIVNQPEDFVPPVEPGVIFQFDFLNFNPDNDSELDGCNSPTYDVNVKESCFLNDADQLVFIDPELQTTTTIVLFTLLPFSLAETNEASCFLLGIEQTMQPDAEGVNMKGFRIQCDGIEGNNFNVNYAFIETNRTATSG